MEKFWDFWDFGQACVKCGHYDNADPKEPTTYLDVETKLCEPCWDKKQEEENTLK